MPKTWRLLSMRPMMFYFRFFNFTWLPNKCSNKLFRARLKRPASILGGGRLTFAQKLMLVDAMAVVEDESVGFLRVINSLRNKSAHVRGWRIEVSDIDRIGQPLGAEYQELKRATAIDRGLTISLVHSLRGGSRNPLDGSRSPSVIRLAN